MSRYLERKLGRFFNKDATALTRTYLTRDHAAVVPSYSPLLYCRLEVDEMAAVPTLVRVDEDRDGVFERTLSVSDYEVTPRNAARGPEPEPYRAIELRNTGTYTSWLDDSLVEVTAVWGWPAVPEAISQATCQLVAILRLETPRASQQITAGIDTVLGTSREAQSIVDSLSSVYAKKWVLV